MWRIAPVQRTPHRRPAAALAFAIRTAYGPFIGRDGSFRAGELVWASPVDDARDVFPLRHLGLTQPPVLEAAAAIVAGTPSAARLTIRQGMVHASGIRARWPAGVTAAFVDAQPIDLVLQPIDRFGQLNHLLGDSIGLEPLFAYGICIGWGAQRRTFVVAWQDGTRYGLNAEWHKV